MDGSEAASLITLSIQPRYTSRILIANCICVHLLNMKSYNLWHKHTSILSNMLWTCSLAHWTSLASVHRVNASVHRVNASVHKVNASVHRVNASVHRVSASVHRVNLPHPHHSILLYYVYGFQRLNKHAWPRSCDNTPHYVCVLHFTTALLQGS